MIARDLDRLNEDRRAIEKVTLELAEAEAERQLRASNNVSCLVVAGDDWHPGVVGLVASRLKDKFNLPSFAIAFNGENGTGSGRGLSGVDLGRTVRAAVDSGRVMKGGGHSMAAGVTLARGQLEDFRGFMNDALQAALAKRGLGEALSIDAALTARGARLDLLRQVEMAGPFGQGNAEPIYALPGHRIAHASVVGADHVRARLQAGDGAQIDAICFRAMASPLGEALLQGRGGVFHVAARLTVGAFRGAEKLDAQIVDMAPVRS